MTTFGELIRSYRQRAGLGLRTFANLIDERTSTVSAVESSRRAPWRREATLQRVAEVLGLVESSNLWQKILGLARGSECNGAPTLAEAPFSQKQGPGRLAWWWCSEDAPTPDFENAAALADFVGAAVKLNTNEEIAAPAAETELAIEWRIRRLLGRRESQVAPAPVDVEAALENRAGVRLEVVSGLIPRFSVQACVVVNETQTTLFIDRIVADSRPMASYRHLLALAYAPAALWQADSSWHAVDFQQLRADESWSHCARDCERFALAMLLPANPVLAGAESAYQELIQQQGWVDVDEAARALRNRLAEQFAVPPALVHRRLVGWPCHIYGRVAQALAAQEMTLPPLDWLADVEAPRQQMLFNVDASAR